MNPLQLINAISAEKVQPNYKGLLYTSVKVNRAIVRAMIDTGITNNFMSLKEAERLGLNVRSAAAGSKQ